MTFCAWKSNYFAHGRRPLGCARYRTHPDTGPTQKFHPLVAKSFLWKAGTNSAAPFPQQIQSDTKRDHHHAVRYHDQDCARVQTRHVVESPVGSRIHRGHAPSIPLKSSR